MPAARAPRRGEPGFAAAARAGGGDPRLTPQQPRSRRLKAVQAPEAPSGRQGGQEPASGPERPAGGRRGTGRGRRRAQQAVERVGAVRVPLSGGVTVDDGAGLLLGVFAWALALQYFRGGLPQAKRFLAAKFLNKT